MKLVLWLSFIFIVTRICPSYVLGNCSLIEIPHGSASFRMRGRSAQYTCEEGFLLYGDSYGQCVNGLWDKPAPSCVAPGCMMIENITNGEVKSSHNGSVVEITCYPGMVRQGESTLTCDGEQWSSVIPLCLEPYQVHQCDFESSVLCGWAQDTDDDFDWTHHSGQTPSGRTGPTTDHTFGAHNTTGHYIYIEASTPRQPGDVARLLSPWYPCNLSDCCFYFWYHMYGRSEVNAVGTLRIGLRTGNRGNFTQTYLWSMSGNQGELWNPGHLRIPGCTGQFQMVMEGVRQDSYHSDIAIDDWLVSPCTSKPLHNLDPAAQIQLQTTNGEQISSVLSSSSTPRNDKFTKELTTSQHSTTANTETSSSTEAESHFTSTYVNNSTSTSEKNTKVSPYKSFNNDSNSSSTMQNAGILYSGVSTYSSEEHQTGAQNDVVTVKTTPIPSTHSLPSTTQTTEVWNETQLKHGGLEGTAPSSVDRHHVHSYTTTHKTVFTANAIVNLIIGLLVLCVFIVILIIMGFVCWKQQKIYNDKYQELKLFVETHYRAKYVNTSMSSKRSKDCT